MKNLFNLLIENYDKNDSSMLELFEEAKKIIPIENILVVNSKDIFGSRKGFDFFDFCDFIEDKLAAEIPCFFTGTIRLAKEILHNRNSNFSHGIHYNENKYSYNWFLSYFGEYALNKHCEIDTYSRFLTHMKYLNDINSQDKIFVRPLSGNKVFNSGVYSISDLASNIDFLTSSSFILPPETLVVFDTPKEINKEYRFFIKSTNFNGKKVDIVGPSSLYIHKDEVITNGEEAPIEVKNFVKKVLEETSERPDILFVLDVAVLEDGSICVLEINGGSTSGIYGTNKKELVELMVQAGEDKLKFIENGNCWERYEEI